MHVYGGTLVPDGVQPDAIVAADPHFRRDDFLAFARTVHRNVHQAAASGDPRMVQAVLGEPMRSSLPRRRDDRAWTAPVERLDHIAILEATHAAVDRIHVRFGAVIAGRPTVEDWVFERTTDAYPHLAGSVPTRCPSCGAPTATDGQGDCRYCGTHVLGVAGDWKVVDVVPPRLVEAPKGPTPSDALGLEHGQEDLLAFVRSIYLNVHEACGEGKLSTIRNVLTSEMRDGIARDPEAHSWGIPIHRVDRMDIVAVQRGALDVITVRIEAVTEGALSSRTGPSNVPRRCRGRDRRGSRRARSAALDPCSMNVETAHIAAPTCSASPATGASRAPFNRRRWRRIPSSCARCSRGRGGAGACSSSWSASRSPPRSSSAASCT